MNLNCKFLMTVTGHLNHGLSKKHMGLLGGNKNGAYFITDKTRKFRLVPDIGYRDIRSLSKDSTALISR